MKKKVLAVMLAIVLVAAGVQTLDIKKNVSASTTEKASTISLNDFDAYYSNDLGATVDNNLLPVKTTDYWSVDGEGIITDNQSVWWNGYDNMWPNVSALVYNAKKYKDFTFSFEFKTVYRGDEGKDNWDYRYGAMIGFGADIVDGKLIGWNGEKTGTWFKPANNYMRMHGSFCNKNNDTDQLKVQWDQWKTCNLANDNWHTMKLVVNTYEDIMQIYVDDVLFWSEQPLSPGSWYDGGYVLLASNNGGTQFKNIQINEIAPDFSRYDSFYSENIGCDRENPKDLTMVDATGYWTENNGTIKRKAVTRTDAADDLEMAELFLNEKEYTNFEIEADVTIGTSGWKRTYIGFGAAKGRHFQQADGGMAIYFESPGVKEDNVDKTWIGWSGNIKNDNGKYDTGVNWGKDAVNSYALDTSAPIHIKMTVKDRVATIYVGDSAKPTYISVPYWYKGGHIFFASNSTGATYSNIKVTELQGTESEDTDSPLYQKSALFIGDSISFGANDNPGDPTGYAWGGRIGEKNDMEWINASHSGATLAQNTVGIPTIEEQLNLDCLQNKDLDYIITEGGINDAMKNAEIGICPLGNITPYFDSEMDKTTFAGALENLFKILTSKYPKARIGYIVTFNIDWISADETNPYFDLAKQICDKWNISYLDLRDDTILDNAMFKTQLADGCHPSPLGYETLTPIIEKWMKTLEVNEKYTISIDNREIELVKKNELYTLPDIAQYGYYYNGKMYKPGAAVKVTSNMDFTSVNELSVTFDANGKAGIKLDGAATPDGKTTSGIRYQATVRAKTVTGDDAMKAVDSDAISEGMLITANDIYQNYGSELDITSTYTVINIPNRGWYDKDGIGTAYSPQVGTYCGAIVNIVESNYIRDFIAKAYVTVNYTDGETITVYSDMSQPRNIRYIANAIIDNNALKNYREVEQEMIKKFAGK